MFFMHCNALWNGWNGMWSHYIFSMVRAWGMLSHSFKTNLSAVRSFSPTDVKDYQVSALQAAKILNSCGTATSDWWAASWSVADHGVLFLGSSEDQNSARRMLAEAPWSTIGRVSQSIQYSSEVFLTSATGLVFVLSRYVLTAAHCLCSTKAAARKKEGWCNGTDNVIEIDSK